MFFENRHGDKQPSVGADVIRKHLFAPLEHSDADPSSWQSPGSPHLQCLWHQIGQRIREGELNHFFSPCLCFIIHRPVWPHSPLQGTVIRVFSIPEGQRLFEFRRGMKRSAHRFFFFFNQKSISKQTVNRQSRKWVMVVLSLNKGFVTRR